MSVVTVTVVHMEEQYNVSENFCLTIIFVSSSLSERYDMTWLMSPTCSIIVNRIENLDPPSPPESFSSHYAGWWHQHQPALSLSSLLRPPSGLLWHQVISWRWHLPKSIRVWLFTAFFLAICLFIFWVVRGSIGQKYLSSSRQQINFIR